MHIGGADVQPLEVVTQFLGHSFCQCSHQCTLAALYPQLDFLNEVIDLSLRGTYDDLRVQETCRADKLLGDDALALLELIIGRCGAHIDGLVSQCLKFLEP